MTRLGLAVSHDAVRGVAVRGSAVVWAAEVRRADASPQSLGADLADLLSGAPRPRWRRLAPKPVANVALGPSCSQMRRLAELPPFDDPQILARVVREGAARFFLRNGVPLASTGVRVVGPGEAWAAALEQPVGDAAAAGCRAAGLRLRAAVPTVGALAAAIAEPGTARVVWRDGPMRAELTIERQRLTSARRLPAAGSAAESAGEPPTLVPALATLGGRAWSYADAYGAAVLAKDEPVALHPGRAAPARGSTPGWRLALASAACLLGVAAAVAAPGVAPMRATQWAARELTTLGPAQRAIAADERDLRHVDAALAEIGAFADRRRSPTLFLDSLATALPRGVSLVSVRLDSAGGHLVALAPRVASVLAELDRVPGVAAPEIVGPVTQEVVGAGAGGHAWSGERATIRFRWTLPGRGSP